MTGVEEEPPPPPPPQAAKNSASAPIEPLAKIRGNRFDNLRALQGLQQFFESKLDTSRALFTSLAGTPVPGMHSIHVQQESRTVLPGVISRRRAQDDDIRIRA